MRFGDIGQQLSLHFLVRHPIFYALAIREDHVAGCPAVYYGCDLSVEGQELHFGVGALAGQGQAKQDHQP